MITMPLIYYPTTLYWVDDDSLFLDVAMEGFSSKYKIKSVSSPKEAIEFFENYRQHINAISLLRSCIDHEDYDLNDHHPVDIAFEALRNIKNNLQKGEDVSIIIVDYIMPKMSGLELCETLQSIPAKKILLTGTADYQEAVKMLNQGIIHAFIRKDDPNIGQNLAINIEKLHGDYFFEQTKPILTHLQSDHLLPQTDPKFIAFFQEMIETHKVREYYLSDKNGSMTLIDIIAI